MKISNFKDFDEFIDKKAINKIIYSNMNYYERRELKEYVYKQLNERNDKKDMMWEYLNEPLESAEYINISLFMNTYKRRKNGKNNN